jgi:hypothetical protein
MKKMLSFSSQKNNQKEEAKIPTLGAAHKGTFT